jgi:2-polyprenyl-6-methoxyphenol hydroxylase-like FAD-dependent oxidoreductase
MANLDRALVVGAGICGLGVGVALAQRGIQVETVERTAEPNVLGVGINQPGNSLRAMRVLGLFEPVRASGCELDEINFRDADGNLVVSVPYHLAGAGVPNAVGISRPELHRILIDRNEDEGVEIRYGTTVAELDDHGDRVEVSFTEGRKGAYDLVVGCDGVNSATRARIFGDRYAPQYTGSGVWRVTVPRPKSVSQIDLFQAADAKAGYIPLSADSMYLLLVCREPHHARYERSRLPAMLRERLAPFGGIVREIRDHISDGDDVIYGPLHEVRVEPPWHTGRVVVCGDAAHASTPHLTQGAAMALEDAVVLAEEVAKHQRPLDESLTAFSSRRYPRTKLVQDASRAILDSEASITAENMQAAFERMRAELPAQSKEIDDFLRQPA